MIDWMLPIEWDDGTPASFSKGFGLTHSAADKWLGVLLPKLPAGVPDHYDFMVGADAGGVAVMLDGTVDAEDFPRHIRNVVTAPAEIDWDAPVEWDDGTPIDDVQPFSLNGRPPAWTVTGPRPPAWDDTCAQPTDGVIVEDDGPVSAFREEIKLRVHNVGQPRTSRPGPVAPPIVLHEDHAHPLFGMF